MARVVVLAAALLGVQGARRERQHHIHETTKFIAGIPILNYELAYGGATSLVERKGKQQWIVVVHDGVADKDIDVLCKMSNCVREGHPDKNGAPYFEIDADEAELEEVLSFGAGAVLFVEPDMEMHLIPDIQEVDAQGAASWGLDRVGVDSRPNSGAGVHVYVLDTGVRTSHNDFGGRAISTLDVSSNSLVECAGKSDCARDLNSHGSHCAGTAAGGSYGIARDATIHAVKVLGDDGNGKFSWCYDALDWLASKGERPAIASMSLGGKGTSRSAETAIHTAVNAGVTVVVAGGNDNSDACGFTPAFVEEAITVGSTTSLDARSSFSNYGACTDIWAPGSRIQSVGIASDYAQRGKSGTSMACPHVAGAAAIILSDSPGLKPSGVTAALKANAEVGAISDLRSGDTNLLLKVGAGRPPVPSPAPTPSPAPPVPSPAPTPSPAPPVTRRRRRKKAAKAAAEAARLALVAGIE